MRVRRHVVPHLPLGTRRWLAGIRDTRRHNAAILRRDPAASALCFYPKRPTHEYAIWRVAAELGLRVVRSRRGGGVLTVAWHDATSVRPEAVASLPAPTLNARCLDISKSTVDRIWRQVSGHGLSLDPLTSVGSILVKSEENGRHDGRIISGPIQERLPGFVYQRLVDNRVGDHFVDLRAVILDGRVVLTYEVRRDIDNRFGGSYDPVNPMASTRIAGPDAFSVEESDALLDFAARIGLDYGELDVLRDADGTTYVVDANKTPMFPRRSLRAPEATVAVKLMADAFQELISRHRDAFE